MNLSLLLFQPNGRFETNTKICLSISNYHPEHWQPSWSGKLMDFYIFLFLPRTTCQKRPYIITVMFFSIRPLDTCNLHEG